MDIFESCHRINDFIKVNQEIDARNELIRLLDYHEKNDIEYSSLLNHLIRETGLYPYLKSDTASWEDRFVYEVFKVDIGGGGNIVHYIESNLLF